VGQFTTLAGGNDFSDGHGYLWDVAQNPKFSEIDISVAADPESLWFGNSGLALSTYAHGINDDGWVVGEYKDPMGTHAFVLNPILWQKFRATRQRIGKGKDEVHR
jgi:hypothetical protein